MSKELRLLIVQERAADADALVRALKSAGFEISARRAGSREEFLRGLHEFEPGAIAAELTLPGLPALEALQLARKLGPNVPFVVVTEAADEDSVLACLRAGADDYVVRPHLARLPAVLTAALDRRRLHSERRQLEETYRTLVENSLQGLAIFQQQKIVYVNAEFARLVGYSPEEILAMPRERVWDSVLSPEREELLRRQRDRLAGKEVPARLEFRLRHRDGSVRWLEVMAALINYLDEPAVLTAFVDITERKQAELELVRSEAMFRAIFDQAQHLAWIVDLDGVLRRANWVARDMIGGEESRCIGLPFWETPWWTHSPAAQEQLRDGMRRAAGGEFVQFETTHLDTAGKLHHIDFTLKPVFDEAGQVFCLIPEGRDVTARKQAEEARRASEAMLKAVLDTIPVRVFWKDRESRYLGCNAPFASDSGLAAPEELLGRDDYQMGWREQADLYRADDRLVMESGEAKLNYEEPQTTPEGGRRWLRTSKIPLRDAKGEIYGVLGTYEDITERKRAEEALRASEARFRALFAALDEGVALHELVLDAAGEPVDYVVLDVNPACERMTGVSREQAVGRRASELYGGPAPLLAEFAAVALSGQPRRFEAFAPPLGKTFSISVYCFGPGQFAAMFVEVPGERPAPSA